ncbi:uncharacterized protein LOC115880147 isoform X2 [Sitophilus oryzae]|uniref:Uncharacterized protein LOC115880147 isoform X2 n=1 Tax=Sitophilus oryzae TaxID=7048 RepID=A0A6J2XPY5_SITOR|nr:uncharacterized protein LOC115880147 isoform X2 [Sitophilus oryzae]XP_030753137.1 uncharacterized protein LOC115880147 isoform X2 [Sitophilus oryzae]
MWSFLGKPDAIKNDDLRYPILNDTNNAVELTTANAESEIKKLGKINIIQNIVVTKATFPERGYENLASIEIPSLEFNNIEPESLQGSTRALPFALSLPSTSKCPMESDANFVDESAKLEQIVSRPESSVAINENEIHFADSSVLNIPTTEEPTDTLSKPDIVSPDISSVALKKKSIVEYLEIPKKPERKAKRNVERVPFAITSKSYQESFEAKRALKLKEETKKLERKRQREEKMSTAKNKKLHKSETKYNQCFICKKSIIKGRRLKCDTCKKDFHERCIPKSHKDHIPVEDDDLFLCHICYKEESDDNSESNQSEEGNEVKDLRNYTNTSELKNTDNQKNIISEEDNKIIEEEIDDLYNYYLQNKDK